MEAEQELTGEPRERSGCAGYAVLAAAALGVGGAVYAVSRDLFVIAVWVVGWVLVYRAAKKVPDAAIPTPPAPSERGSEKEPQVTMVRDISHPNRWIVAKESPWVTEEIDKERR